MSAKFTLVAISSLLLLGTLAFATPLQIINADFSAVPVVCGLGYAYQVFGGNCNTLPPQQDFNNAPGFGWTLQPPGGRDGLTGPNTNFNPPDFTGLPFTQAVFLQGAGSLVYQDIPGFSAGTNYLVNFYLGSRYFGDGTDGNQTVEALIDDTVIGTWALVSFTPFELESVQFSVPTDGVHRLTFMGTAVGDHTAFVSGVSINEVPEPGSLTLIAAGMLAANALRRKIKQ